jgi:hypothetical protein
MRILHAALAITRTWVMPALNTADGTEVPALAKKFCVVPSRTGMMLS